MEPLAGAAPARFSYKENLQAAAKRQKKWWAATVLPRVLRFKRPLHHSLMLAARNAVGSEPWFVLLHCVLIMLVLFAIFQTMWFII